MATARLLESNESLDVRKIICIGRNYSDHAKEMNAPIPEAPVFFLKPPTAVIGEGESIAIPSISHDLHHEVEMTVLIGRGGKNIRKEDAFGHIAGYGIGLDMTLRDVQSEAKKKGLPWTLAKGFDTSAPMSGFLPAARIADPHNVQVSLEVNGTLRQKSSTGNFLFRIDDLIAYISRFMTLERGDVMFTGTPEGVAAVTSGDRLVAKLLTPNDSPLISLMVNVG